MAILPVEGMQLHAHPGAALDDGDRVLIIGPDGAFSFSPDLRKEGPEAASPATTGETMDSRLYPYPEGLIRIRTHGKERVLSEVEFVSLSNPEGTPRLLRTPAPNISGFLACFNGSTLLVAGSNEAGVQLWSLAAGEREWKAIPLPQSIAEARPVALEWSMDRLFLVCQKGNGSVLWAQDPLTGWSELGPVPEELEADELALFPLSGTHLGFMQKGKPVHETWTFNLVTRVWASYPLRELLIHAGGRYRKGGSAICGLLGWRSSGEGSHELMKLQLQPRQPRFGLVNFATLGLYLAGTMGIGLFFMYRTKNTNDYFLAGGRIPWWAAGISVYATMLSPITVMAMSGKSYLTDWTFLLAPATILILAPIVMRWYLPFFRQLKAASAYEYLERRFHYNLRVYAGAAFILFQTGRMAIVIFLPSLALSTVVGLDIYICILLMGGVCTVYTMLGGIEGVIWNDVLQTVVMLGSSLVCIIFVAYSLDSGFLELAAEAIQDGKVRVVDWSFSFVHASTWIIVIGSLINNLVPYTSDQTVIQRYMTTRSEAMARRSIWLNGLMSPPSALVFFMLGTGFYLFFKHHPGALHPSVTPDSILPYFVHEHLPTGIAGVVIAGIFAASQSSVSSSLNSVATVLVTDLLPGRKGNRSDATGLWLARACTVVVGIICTAVAMVMADQSIESFFDSYLKLVAITGSGLAGLFSLGIFSGRANALSAGLGVAASAAMVYFVQRHTELHFFLYGMAGFSVCIAVGSLCVWGKSASRESLAGLTWRTRLRKQPD
jgi:SSS family transporter